MSEIELKESNRTIEFSYFDSKVEELNNIDKKSNESLPIVEENQKENIETSEIFDIEKDEAEIKMVKDMAPKQESDEFSKLHEKENDKKEQDLGTERLQTEEALAEKTLSLQKQVYEQGKSIEELEKRLEEEQAINNKLEEDKEAIRKKEFEEAEKKRVEEEAENKRVEEELEKKRGEEELEKKRVEEEAEKKRGEEEAEKKRAEEELEKTHIAEEKVKYEDTQKYSTQQHNAKKESIPVKTAPYNDSQISERTVTKQKLFKQEKLYKDYCEGFMSQFDQARVTSAQMIANKTIYPSINGTIPLTQSQIIQKKRACEDYSSHRVMELIPQATGYLQEFFREDIQLEVKLNIGSKIHQNGLNMDTFVKKIQEDKSNFTNLNKIMDSVTTTCIIDSKKRLGIQNTTDEQIIPWILNLKSKLNHIQVSDEHQYLMAAFNQKYMSFENSVQYKLGIFDAINLQNGFIYTGKAQECKDNIEIENIMANYLQNDKYNSNIIIVGDKPKKKSTNSWFSNMFCCSASKSLK